MNILLLTASMDNGGAETHVYELARALAARGHSITVASSGGRLASRLCAEGILHVSIPFGKRSPVALLSAYRALSRLIRKRKFQVVHAHSRICAFLAHGICARHRICFITTAHAKYAPNKMLDRLSRWGGGAIAVSNDIYLHLLRHSQRLPFEKVAVIPNGVDTDRFIPAKHRGAGAFKIVYMSRLDADCSLTAYSLCRIAKRLASLERELRIVIGGGGSEYWAIFAEAQKINRAVGYTLVETVGHVDDSPAFLKDADVFVGVSRAALEAMSCAVPVVLAGDEGFLGVASAGALAEGEHSNFCCRGGKKLSDDVLFEALRSVILMSENERGALGEELREYVLSLHSVSSMADKTERFYKAVYRRERSGEGGVLLCGYYGYGNMGDDILLSSSIARARKRYGSLPICALTKRGWRDSSAFGVRCKKRTRPLTLLREIERSRVVVFGGGTLLQSTTSSRSLLYYLFILRYAQMRGKRTELWGNGLGEISSRALRRATAKALCGCERVCLRDKESVLAARALVSEYGHALPRICEERDLAAGYIKASEDRAAYLLGELGLRKESRIAAVAVRGRERRGYMQSFERWLRRLASDGFRLVFIVMYPAEDLKACRRLCRETRGVLAYPLGASDILALIGHASVVCSSRFHVLVLASDAGVPFIGFGGESKIESFCRSNGGVYYTELE